MIQLNLSLRENCIPEYKLRGMTPETKMAIN